MTILSLFSGKGRECACCKFQNLINHLLNLKFTNRLVSLWENIWFFLRKIKEFTPLEEMTEMIWFWKKIQFQDSIVLLSTIKVGGLLEI